MQAARRNSLRELINTDPSLVMQALIPETKSSAQDPDVWFLLGLSLFRLNHFDKASDCFQEGARLDPSNALTFYYIGLSAERLSLKDEAVEAYRQAIALKRDFVEAINKLHQLTGESIGLPPTVPPSRKANSKTKRLLAIGAIVAILGFIIFIAMMVFQSFNQINEAKRFQCQQMSRTVPWEELPPWCQKIVQGQ